MSDEIVARAGITREEARAQGLTRYTIGKPCRKKKHPCNRFVSNAGCSYCHDEKRAANPIDPEKAKRYRETWKTKNPGKAEAYAREYYERNLEKFREQSRRWKAENPHKAQGSRREYVERRRHATPKWLTENDQLQMLAIYKESRRRSRETGIRHAVDHVIPLNGLLVCGLHCPENLEIVTLRENSKKGNSHGGVGRSTKLKDANLV